MANITFVDFENNARTVEIKDGLSVMEGALRHHIPGIEGDCGGACACGTCHVHVDLQWLDKLQGASELEQQMLNITPGRDATSRLACQIVVSPALEGLTVRTPESQY